MGRKLSPKHVVMITVVIAGAAIGLGLLLGRKGPSDDSFTIRGVLPIDGDTLLVVERAGMSNDTYDRGRLRVIKRDGTEVRRSAAVKSALTVHGIAGAHVWLTSHDDGLEAWRLADLAPQPGAEKAIQAHAMLSRKRNVVGLTNDAVVTRAADDKLYTITSTYAIAQQPKELSYRAIAARSESVDMFPLVAEDGRAHVRAGTSLDKTELVRPSAVMTLDVSNASEAGAGSASVLAHSIDFEGAGNSGIVSRIEDGKARWSVTARDVLGAHPLGKDATFTFKFVELRAGALWVVAEAGVWHVPRADSSNSRGHGDYVHQIASIDPASGTVRSSQRIK